MSAAQETKKDVVVNGRPFHVEVECFDKGFTLSFWVSIEGRSDGSCKKINLTFDRWWVGYISKCLAKVLRSERYELQRIENITLREFDFLDE